RLHPLQDGSPPTSERRSCTRGHLRHPRLTELSDLLPSRKIRVDLLALRFGLEVAKQVHLNCRAAPRFAIDFHMTAGLLDKPVYLTEAETGALSFRLGGIKRFESPGCHR